MIGRAAALPLLTELFAAIEAQGDAAANVFWGRFQSEVLPLLRDPNLSAALTAWWQLRREPSFRARCDVSMQMGAKASEFTVVLCVRNAATTQDEAVALCTAIGRQVLKPLGYTYRLSRSGQEASKYFIQLQTRSPANE